MYDRKSVKYSAVSDHWTWGVYLDELIDQLHHPTVYESRAIPTSLHLAASSTSAPAHPSVRSRTRSYEPKSPVPVQCPDGCGAMVWVVGDEQGRNLLLDTGPLAAGTGGYAVEPLYVGPAADVVEIKTDTDAPAAKDFAEFPDAWNWYATYESTLVTSNNCRFGLHVLTCTRKTMKQRARATNGQTFGGCCIPRRERKSTEVRTAHPTGE